jgi:hypothetical protein
MEPITRAEAKAKGLKHYIPKKPCIRGHTSKRLVSIGNCCQCDLERSRTPKYLSTRKVYEQTDKSKATKAIYREKPENKERHKQYAKEYSVLNSDTIKKKNSDYHSRTWSDNYAKNKDAILAANKKWRLANPEKIKELSARYTDINAIYIAAYRVQNKEKLAAQQAEYYMANRDKLAAYATAYQKANPHLANAINAKRRAAKLNATPAWADLEAIKKIYDDCAFITQATGVQHHVDHIIPLQGKTVCGLHTEANLQIITASDNIKKSNKLLPMF